MTCQSSTSGCASANALISSSFTVPACICKKSGVSACSISVWIEDSRETDKSTVRANSMAETVINATVAAVNSLFFLISFKISLFLMRSSFPGHGYS